MKRSVVFLLAELSFLVSLLFLLPESAKGEPLSPTAASGGLFRSTAKEESGLVRKVAAEEGSSFPAAAANDHDGGFSSLDGMLQWAIGHSDPAKLKETAQDVRRLSPGELKKRQMEIKELIEKLKTPSDVQLMKIAFDELNNPSLSLEDRHRALQELLILVEPIDNANDLNKLGDLTVIIRELNHPDSDIRKISAWIIGKACQNNAVLQNQVLELGALGKLMKMVKSASVEEAIKALYAVSALIRNNLAGQELFYAEAGDLLLQDVLNNSSNDVRLRRKAVFLVADLAECQLENFERTKLPFYGNHQLLKSVVDLTASSDLDLQEKALAAIKNLLQLRTTDALIFKDYCNLDDVLERMRQRLLDLMSEEYQGGYATDMESLRREVELLYRTKLRNEGTVPK